MTAAATDTVITLPRDSNQAIGIGQYAIDFMSGTIGTPCDTVEKRTTQFLVDSVLCGL